MPRLKRMIQRWIISRRARRPVTVNEARSKLFPRVSVAHQMIRQNLNTPSSNQVANVMFAHIHHAKGRFALVRAFRAAHIFGNETRNEIIQTRNRERIDQILGKRRAHVFWKTYQETLHTTGEAEQHIFVKGEQHQVKSGKAPPQRPVHGRVFQGKFGIPLRKKAG